jgi:hypothetical protein
VTATSLLPVAIARQCTSGTYRCQNLQPVPSLISEEIEAVFMRVNTRCAHQLRPPLGGVALGWAQHRQLLGRLDSATRAGAE